MELIEWSIAYSDNSHLFGIPAQVVERIELFMEIPILKDNGERDFPKLREWVRRTAFLRNAGINSHFAYL